MGLSVVSGAVLVSGGVTAEGSKDRRDEMSIGYEEFLKQLRADGSICDSLPLKILLEKIEHSLRRMTEPVIGIQSFLSTFDPKHLFFNV